MKKKPLQARGKRTHAFPKNMENFNLAFLTKDGLIQINRITFSAK